MKLKSPLTKEEVFTNVVKVLAVSQEASAMGIEVGARLVVTDVFEFLGDSYVRPSQILRDAN